MPYLALADQAEMPAAAPWSAEAPTRFFPLKPRRLAMPLPPASPVKSAASIPAKETSPMTVEQAREIISLFEGE